MLNNKGNINKQFKKKNLFLWEVRLENYSYDTLVLVWGEGKKNHSYDQWAIKIEKISGGDYGSLRFAENPLSTVGLHFEIKLALIKPNSSWHHPPPFSRLLLHPVSSVRLEGQLSLLAGQRGGGWLAMMRTRFESLILSTFSSNNNNRQGLEANSFMFELEIHV